jgi:hypothetical protein
MQPAAPAREGLYVSYNEQTYGPFDQAVQISNQLGCLTFLSRAPRNPHRLDYPTDIIVRLSGGAPEAARYFRGILLRMVRVEDLPDDFTEAGEANHRAPQWRVGGIPLREAEIVLFMSHLREEHEPVEVAGREVPQSPQYFTLATGRAGAWVQLFPPPAGPAGQGTA